MNLKVIASTVFFMVIMTATGVGGMPEPRQEDLKKAMEVLIRIDDAYLPLEKYTQEQLINWNHHARYSGEYGTEAIVHLWHAGHHEAVELTWWRSPYRTTRLMAILLYYKTYPDRDLSFLPNFKRASARFEAQESKYRLEEIEYVEKHYNEIRVIMKNIMGTKSWDGFYAFDGDSK